MARYDGSIRIDTQINSKNASAQLMSLESRIAKTADKIASLRSKIDALKNAQIPTQEYKEIADQIAKAETEFNKLLEKQEQMQREGKDNGVAWERLNYEMEEVGNTIRYAKGELQDLVDTGKAFAPGTSTEEYTKLGQQLEYLENDYSTLIQRRNEFMQRHDIQAGGYERLQAALAELQNSISRLLHPIESMKSSFSSAFENIKEKAARVAAAVLNGISHPFQTAGKAAESAISGIPKLMKGIASSVGKAGSAIKNAASGVKKFGSFVKSTFSNFHKSTEKSNSSISTLGSRFKGLALSLLIFNQLSKAFNSLMSGIKQGFGNMYKEMEGFKNSVNGLKASALTLKNSFAAAFRPLVEVAIPYIQKAMNALSSLMNKVGQFLAAVTGQKTYTKAVQQTAAAFEETTDATKDAEKAAEGYLSPLDEINKFQGPDDSSDKKKGSSDSGGTGEMFETVPVENSMFDFVDKIKGIFYNEDWEGLGAYMASGLNAGLQKVYDIINWENVGPKITYFVNAFTSTFNSLVNKLDWGLLGRTVGAGLNTVVKTVNMFVDKIDWVNLGTKFSEGFNGFVDEVNWDEVGAFFGNKFKILNETIYGFVTNLNFDNIGTAIANGFNGLFNRIDLTMFAESVGTFVNGIFDMIGTFITEFDWSGFASNIYDGINKLFSTIDWANAGEVLGDLLKKLLDTVIDLVEGIDWAEIGRAIWDFIANIDWGGLIVRILVLAYDLIVAACDLLLGFLGGLWENIKLVFAFVADWFGDLFTDAWNAIKSAWSAVVDFFSGIWEGIKKIFSIVGSWFSDVFQAAVDGIKKVFGVVAEFFSGVWKGIKKVFSSVGSWFSDKFKAAVSGIKSAFSSVKNFFSDIWKGIKNAFGNIAGWFKDKFSAAWTAVKNVFSKGGKIFDGIKDGILNGLKVVINGLIGGINKVIAVPFKGINAALKTIKKISIAGFEPFDWISTIDVPQIPKLATGTVIPPNKEFLAVLGDQKHGTNIEAPLSTIEQAVENAMNKTAGSGKEITIKVPVYLDGKQIYESVIKYGKIQQMSTGSNDFMLGTI